MSYKFGGFAAIQLFFHWLSSGMILARVGLLLGNRLVLLYVTSRLSKRVLF